MNVRIGNDIRFNLTLKGPRNYNQTNIKQLRAYLINTSLKDYTEMWAPCCDCGRSHPCGKFGYHHPVYNSYTCIDRFHRAFKNPCKHCCCCKNDDYIPFNPAFGQGPLPPKYEYNHRCCKCNKDFDFPVMPMHIDEDFKYLAPSRVLPKPNQVQVYFPAHEQFACGVYKLVIVVVVYEAGWGRCDLHTYTIDYGDVVTLVDDNTGVDGDITIDVDTDQLANSGVMDIKTSRSDFYMYPNQTLMLGGKDNYNKDYTIDVTLENGSTLEYMPNNWPYSKLEFQSSDPDLVQVGPDGSLISKSSTTNRKAIITITTPDDPNVSITFNVNIEGSAKDYIGFAPVRPLSQNGINREDQDFENPSQESSDVVPGGASNVDFNSSTFRQIEISGTHHVNNNNAGWYLWIASRTPIKNVMIGEFKMPITAAEYIQKDRLYCYACPNPVQDTSAFGGLDVTVTI